MFKQEKGVTLVALVITIIVLLILAGVSIAMLTGDNGVLTKSQDAVAKNAIAGAKDEVNLIYQETLTEYLEAKYTGATAVTLDTTMKSKIDAMTTAQKHDCEVTMTGTTVTIKYSQNGKETTSEGTLTTTAGAETFTWTK